MELCLCCNIFNAIHRSSDIPWRRSCLNCVTLKYFNFTECQKKNNKNFVPCIIQLIQFVWCNFLHIQTWFVTCFLLQFVRNSRLLAKTSIWTSSKPTLDQCTLRLNRSLFIWLAELLTSLLPRGVFSVLRDFIGQ